MVDLGTDYAVHGKLDSKGQIPTVSGRDNLTQAIKKRLLTYKGTYSYIDEDLGSNLKDYLGLPSNELNQQVICLEIETTLLNDVRIEYVEANYENGNFKYKGRTVTGEEFEGII